MESITPAIIFILFGGLSLLYPSLLLRFQIWTQKIIMKAQYIPSRRTYIVVRIMGAIFLALGIFALFGILNIT